MNRRGFLGSLVGGIAAAAAVRTFPFRVYSFASEPVVPLYPLPDEIFVDTPFFNQWIRMGMNVYSKDPRGQVRIVNVFAPSPDEVERYA